MHDLPGRCGLRGRARNARVGRRPGAHGRRRDHASQLDPDRRAARRAQPADTGRRSPDQRARSAARRLRLAPRSQLPGALPAPRRRRRLPVVDRQGRGTGDHRGGGSDRGHARQRPPPGLHRLVQRRPVRPAGVGDLPRRAADPLDRRALPHGREAPRPRDRRPLDGRRRGDSLRSAPPGPVRPRRRLLARGRPHRPRADRAQPARAGVARRIQLARLRAVRHPGGALAR